MTQQPSGPMTRLHNRLAPVFNRPSVLAFLPAVTLGAFWLGGEQALVVVALFLSLSFAVLSTRAGRSRLTSLPRDRVTGLILRDGFDELVRHCYADTETSGLRTACFVLHLDDFQAIADRHGQAAADVIAQRCGERIMAALRDGDIAARISDGRFAICLRPVRQLDLELCIQIAGRIQASIEEPVPLDNLSVYVSCSVGFCLRSRAPGQSGQDWLEAATAALTCAKQSGPSAIRAFSSEIHHQARTRSDLRESAVAALENGQLQPWYQPQISTDTGKVTGFEALARWHHPKHGLITPDHFLPALEDAGLMVRLGQVMLYHSLTALKAWDSAGVDVPRVGVNFAGDELRDPALVDKVRWELDRFELTPDRLAIEILETVVTDCPDDTVTRNIARFAALGCRIDLDDFGTGHASIASIRRFAVSRIKIDRSFVMKADRDPEQQRMIGAILTMAERLELESLAEGVETVGEHALLAQLGCDHVQGFGIARPMPFDQTLDWIAAHNAKLLVAPRIGRDTG